MKKLIPFIIVFIFLLITLIVLKRENSKVGNSKKKPLPALVKKKVLEYNEFTNDIIIKRFAGYDKLNSYLLTNSDIKHKIWIEQQVMTFDPPFDDDNKIIEYHCTSELKFSVKLPLSVLRDYGLLEDDFKGVPRKNMLKVFRLDSSVLFNEKGETGKSDGVPVMLSNQLTELLRLKTMCSAQYGKVILFYIHDKKRDVQWDEWYKNKRSVEKDKWSGYKKVIE